MSGKLIVVICRAAAAAGVALAFAGIWVAALDSGQTYWQFAGQVGTVALALAALAALLLAAALAGRSTDAWLFGAGAVLLGYDAWYPAALAIHNWNQSGTGMWLALGGALLIVLGSGASIAARSMLQDTRRGVHPETLVTAAGLAAVFPGVFLHAGQSGESYWRLSTLGHSLGIAMLIVAGASCLALIAGVAGVRTRGLDQALTLVLLGLAAFVPVGAAFADFGSLRVGAWLAFGGAIVAATGTWVARGTPVPTAAPARA